MYSRSIVIVGATSRKLIREFNIIPHTTYDGLNILKGYMDENDNTKF